MDKITAPTKPLDGRSCGSCTLCCKIMGVPELNKPRGAWCVHCDVGSGCRIYADRPEECRSFLCGWLTNPRFGPEWKPDRSKIVITVDRDGNGLTFQCDRGFPQAWRKEPYHSQIMKLVAIAAEHDGMISVHSGQSLIAILPTGEFPVGQGDPSDEIIREYSGGRLVAVRLAKAVGA